MGLLMEMRVEAGGEIEARQPRLGHNDVFVGRRLAGAFRRPSLDVIRVTSTIPYSSQGATRPKGARLRVRLLLCDSNIDAVQTRK